MTQRILPFLFVPVSSPVSCTENKIVTEASGVTGSYAKVNRRFPRLYRLSSLRWFAILVLLFATIPELRAQLAPFLPTNPVCPNSTVEIGYSGVGSVQDSLVVQLSNGGDYYTIPSVFYSTETRGFGAASLTKYKATIPGNTPAGVYSVRFTSRTRVGTPQHDEADDKLEARSAYN